MPEKESENKMFSMLRLSCLWMSPRTINLILDNYWGFNTFLCHLLEVLTPYRCQRACSFYLSSFFPSKSSYTIKLERNIRKTFLKWCGFNLRAGELERSSNFAREKKKILSFHFLVCLEMILPVTCGLRVPKNHEERKTKKKRKRQKKRKQ